MVCSGVREVLRVREAISEVGKWKEASWNLCHQLEQENRLNQFAQGLLQKFHIGGFISDMINFHFPLPIQFG